MTGNQEKSDVWITRHWIKPSLIPSPGQQAVVKEEPNLKTSSPLPAHLYIEGHVHSPRTPDPFTFLPPSPPTCVRLWASQRHTKS